MLTSLFRALCALAVGILLVSNPTEMTSLLVQIIGGLFIFSGLLAFVGYYVARYRIRLAQKRLAALADVGSDAITLPLPSSVSLIVGVGSVALGVFLILNPSMFIHILLYVLGALLILLGFYQVSALIGFRRVLPLTFSLFVTPILVAAAGVFVIFKPMEASALPFTILGVGYILYGVAECFFSVRARRFRQHLEAEQVAIQDITDAEVIEPSLPAPDRLP